VSAQPIKIRPAGPGDRDQVWPLARALATSYVVERPAFGQSFATLLAHPDTLVLIAETLTNPADPSPTDPINPMSPAKFTEPASHTLPVNTTSPKAPSGEVVGYLLATSHPAFHANGLVAWVEEVMVAEPARGTGVGRQLMAAAEARARRRGARYVALATRRAAPFYQALGYEDSAVYFKKPLT
jgi:ribosomal protein S18 acetylase RimI-like enzyme